MCKICPNFQKLTFINDKTIVFVKPVAIKFFNTNLILRHPVSLIPIFVGKIQFPVNGKKNAIVSEFELQISRKIVFVSYRINAKETHKIFS